MTTVEFGGGASIELRRKFCAPKDGAQIPGCVLLYRPDEILWWPDKDFDGPLEGC